MKIASEAANAIPVVGGTVSTVLNVISIILQDIDASIRMPEFLRQCRSKLVHVQQLLTDFDSHKLTSAGITNDYFEELQGQLDDFKKYVEEKLEKNQSTSKFDKLMSVFQGQSDLDKTTEFNK